MPVHGSLTAPTSKSCPLQRIHTTTMHASREEDIYAALHLGMSPPRSHTSLNLPEPIWSSISISLQDSPRSASQTVGAYICECVLSSMPLVGMLLNYVLVDPAGEFFVIFLPSRSHLTSSPALIPSINLFLRPRDLHLVFGRLLWFLLYHC